MARYENLVEALNLDPNQWRVSGRPAVTADTANKPIAQRQYTIVLVGPNGQFRNVALSVDPNQEALGGTMPKPGGSEGETVTVREKPIEQIEFLTGEISDVKGETKTAEETNAVIAKAQADKTAAEAAAETARANLEKIKTDNAKRDANVSSRGLWMTDQEIADMDAKLRDQGLTQQQITNQLKIASDNNQISRTSNEIAATNAATTAFTASKNAEIAEARLKFEQTGLDEQIFQNTFTRGQAEIANRLAQDKLELDRLQQRQSNEIAERAARVSETGNVIRREELAQRGTEAQQTAATAAQGQALQGAASMYGAERTAQMQAAATGQNLLQQRATSFQNLSQAPFQQAAQLSQGSAGRYGMLGGGLHAMPEGAVGNILQGAMGVSGQLAGGQSALQAAVQAVEGIRPGASLTPQGQAALGVYSQMQERIQQLLSGSGVKAPVTTTTQPAAQPVQPAVPVVAPITQPSPQQLANQQIASAQTAHATERATQLGGGFGAIGANPMLNAMQAFQAPVTAPAPTININV